MGTDNLCGSIDCPLEHQIIHQTDKINSKEREVKAKDAYEQFVKIRDNIHEAIQVEDKELYLNILYFLACDCLSLRFMHNRNKFFSDDELIKNPGIIDEYLRDDSRNIKHASWVCILDNLKNTSND